MGENGRVVGGERQCTSIQFPLLHNLSSSSLYRYNELQVRDFRKDAVDTVLVHLALDEVEEALAVCDRLKVGKEALKGAVEGSKNCMRVYEHAIEIWVLQRTSSGLSDFMSNLDIKFDAGVHVCCVLYLYCIFVCNEHRMARLCRRLI